MRALVCEEYGPYQSLKLKDVATPEPKPGEVRIRVASAGVSYAVILGIAGKHQNKPGLPYIPGSEVAGTVDALGAGVADLKIGDAVTALAGARAYAEFCCAPAANVWRIPKGVAPSDAMTAVGTHGSVFMALDWLARLQKAEWLLVSGAGGGSGLSAVALAKAIGARSIAVAGGADKLAAAKQAGAEQLIDHRSEDVRERVLAITGGRGADVVFDPVGSPFFDTALRCIAPEGRLIPYGFAGGTIPQIPANILLVKNVSVIGFYFGYYLGWAKLQAPPEAKARLRATMEKLLAWIAEGRLQPLPCQSFPFERFAEAMAPIDERRAVGKIALTF